MSKPAPIGTRTARLGAPQLEALRALRRRVNIPVRYLLDQLVDRYVADLERRLTGPVVASPRRVR